MVKESVQTQFNMSFLWLICFVAAMGGLLFGYDWVVIGGAKMFYEPFFDIGGNVKLQGWAMSSALLGCLAGAVVSGALADRFGRKPLLILAAALFTISAIGTGLAENFMMFNVYRIIGGIGIGLASNLSPMYIAEVAPAHLRGRFVSINQLTIVIGVLAAQLVNLQIAQPVPSGDDLRLLNSDSDIIMQLYANEEGFDLKEKRHSIEAMLDKQAYAAVLEAYPDLTADVIDKENKDAVAAYEKENNAISSSYINETWNGQKGWRWMFGAETVPALLFFLLMCFLPESPRWLITKGRLDQANKILTRVGGQAFAEFEVNDIGSTINAEAGQGVNYGELFSGKLFKILCLGMFLAFFQQWCGINVIFNYAQEIFAAAGYELNGTMDNIVATGIVNLVFTFVGIFTVDKLGRRFLMVYGFGGLAVIYALLGSCYYYKNVMGGDIQGWVMLVLVLVAIAFYSMSLAPVTWVLISEIFPNRIRGAAVSISVFTLWVGCWLLTNYFPKMNKALGAHGAFWVFGGICVIGFVVLLIALPETKNKSLEEIERELIG